MKHAPLSGGAHVHATTHRGLGESLKHHADLMIDPVPLALEAPRWTRKMRVAWQDYGET